MNIKFQYCTGDKLPPGGCTVGNGFNQTLLSCGTCNLKLKQHIECTLRTFCNIQDVSFRAGFLAVERTISLTHGNWYEFTDSSPAPPPEFTILLKKTHSVLTKSILFSFYVHLDLPESFFRFTRLTFLSIFYLYNALFNFFPVSPFNTVLLSCGASAQRRSWPPHSWCF